MNEAAFVSWILATAKVFGWRGWHVPMPVRPIGGGQFVPEPRAKGLPDLVLMHSSPRRQILAECKRNDKATDLSAEQVEFLSLAAGLARDLADHERHVREVVQGLGGPAEAEWQNPLGVYVWVEGRDERTIEDILRSKVMVAP